MLSSLHRSIKLVKCLWRDSDPAIRPAEGTQRFTSSPDDVNLATMKATAREPEIVTRNGKPVSVIIPIKDYEELLERAEDAEDALAQARAPQEASLSPA